MATNRGYVKIYRKIRDSAVWHDPLKLRLWEILLMKANHSKDYNFQSGTRKQIQRGELMTGRFSLAREYNEGLSKRYQRHPDTIWRWVNEFKKSGMIQVRSYSEYSVVTITNWKKYQVDEDE
ncbi:hypothetical protein [Levilactobacillus brevis]|uniref:hypothetical protein n=1 Tax=Levilactobacillus brevis TaxID=1580 RepID=UPI0035A3B777